MSDRELLEMIAQKIVRIDGEIMDIKTGLAKTQDNIGIMQNDIGKIQDDIGKMRNDIGKIQDDIVIMQNDIGKIQNDIGIMQNDIKDLQQQVVIMEQTAGLTEFRVSATYALENCKDSLEFWKARQIALEEEVFRLKKKIS